MRARIEPVLPVLTRLFDGIAVQASQAADPAAVAVLGAAGHGSDSTCLARPDSLDEYALHPCSERWAWQPTMCCSASSTACSPGSNEELGVGADAAWPLSLLASGAFEVGHVACDGLAFESADRFADQVAAAGGVETWKAHIDGDPRRWADRVALVRQQLEAMRISLQR